MPNSSRIDDRGENIDLTIVIVSWNIRDVLKKCILSINDNHGSLDIEVIVVDSGSSDGTPEMIREEFPWVYLIARQDNVGFPKGNNIGIAKAAGRFILLLNPDTEVQGEALSLMVRYLQMHDTIGIVGPQLLNPDGSTQSSRRRFPTVMTGLFESTWLQPIAPRSLMDDYFAADLADDEVSEVDWLVGACLMTRREVLEQVGPLDEEYFMYSEELDWCRRVKEAGWEIIYYPDAKIIHHIGKSSEQAVTERHVNYQRAKLRYFRKFHGRGAAGILRFVLLMNYAVQIVLESSKGLLGHRRPLRKQRVRAYWAVLRSGLGPAGY
jgi:N-acetylglucosaminyl-diphospho-decaprenol L-rhamnosyltransferase